MIRNFLRQHSRPCSVCLALLCTFLIWLASSAYSESHPTRVLMPDHPALAAPEEQRSHHLFGFVKPPACREA